jgi:hypothetical protein
MIDVTKYLGAAFLKTEDVAAGPLRVTIVDVVDGKYDKPDIIFDDGTRLSSNVTNTRILARAYGATSTADWIGKEIELSLGEVKFQDKTQVSILVRPISPPIEKKSPLKQKPGGDMEDEVPFDL